MLTIPLANGGTLQVSIPELERELLLTHAERLAVAEAEQRSLSQVYRIDGAPEQHAPFGGLLTARLGISERTARQLLVDGRIGYTCVGAKKGYRISERQVREFLGDALPPIPEA